MITILSCHESTLIVRVYFYGSVVVSKRRLHLLINLLTKESCKDSSFMKISTLSRRLSRVEVSGCAFQP